MLSKSEINFLKSLHQKKYRQEHQCFLAEGLKVVDDLLSSEYTIRQVLTTERFAMSHPALLKKVRNGAIHRNITSKEFSQVSTLSTPQEVLAVAAIPEFRYDSKTATGALVLVLDDLSDPGNLGTIIRTADWFGIRHIVCSEKTVDAFNPKTVQAAMGSLFRMKICYMNLPELFSTNIREVKAPVYGTVLNGANIYQAQLEPQGYILLGNESNGIGDASARFITQPVTIPRDGTGSGKVHVAESLNVAISAAIVCSEFRRRGHEKSTG